VQVANSQDHSKRRKNEERQAATHAWIVWEVANGKAAHRRCNPDG
jgi:hypothetical protein